MAAEFPDDSLVRYLRLLTPRGKQVINLAQLYSERLGVIHMEHLVFALVDLKTTITTLVLNHLKITRKRFESELSKFDVPRRVITTPPPMRHPVHFSRHALEAMRSANEFRIKRGGKSIRSRDLLVGVLSVPECTVVQRLQGLGIKKEMVEAEIAEDDARRGRGTWKSEVSQAPAQARQSDEAFPPADAERIRAILITGNDDERQVVIDEIANSANALDYGELRRQLITDLASTFSPPDPRSRSRDETASVRSWMASALGLIGHGDSVVTDTLRRLVHPDVEPNESVRFWSVAAFWRLTQEFPTEVKLLGDDKSIVALAEALRAKRQGQTPKLFFRALQDGPPDTVWGILRALRIVPFPELVPLLCGLLQRQKIERGNVIPYETLQALTNEEVLEVSAEELMKVLGLERVVNYVVYTLLDSNHAYRKRFSRLLACMPAAATRALLQDSAESRNQAIASVGQELLGYLDPSFAIDVNEIPPVAGYISDSIPESNQDLEDELGIRNDVKTLCSVLLAYQVKPPLAVGLFGDWGTGKSYFMQKMYWEIKDLSRRAAKASKTAYHSKVVQIRFNAWHYADSSLWASLVTHIFDELSKEVSPEEDPEETKKKLLVQLESAKQARVEAEEEQKRAVSERNLAKNSLEEIREEREKSQVQLSRLRLPDLADVLTGPEQDQLKEQLQGVLDGLGFPSALNSVDELNGIYKQAFTLGGRIQAAIVSIWRSANPKAVLALLVLAVLFFPLASWGIEKLSHSPGIAALSALIADAALTIGAVAASFKKGLSVVSDLLAKFEAKRNNVLQLLDKKRNEVSEEELALRQKLESLQAAEDAARNRVSEADAKVREVEQKLADIKEGRSLSKFLLERVQAEDYRKHLGLISVIRKDFERLNYLLTRGEEGLEKVGRIILYVDDLDRCPADKVVDVLQAIHLLLALPLFVAVVGVDLRWLLHSLDQQYTAFQAGNSRTAAGRSPRPEWVTDPQNYLEKIFQIPFTLHPMQEPGYEKLISVLMPEAKVDSANMSQPVETAVKGGPQEDNKAGDIGLVNTERKGEDVAGEGVQEVEKQQPTESADINEDRDLDPEALIIRSWERTFAVTMFPFIPTPRAAKRFTNTYRILKAPLTKKELAAFEGTSENPGEFQAAMLLLGIAIRFSREAMDLFPEILQAQKGDNTWRTVIRNHLRMDESQSAILEGVDLANDPFVNWVPGVARFTFEAAKTVQARSDAGSHQKSKAI